jgi:phenylalanyl-tRNA synthetase beta chain
MRVPVEWLREYCDPPLSTQEIEERLTMTGTKVEAIHHHGVSALEHFVVGRVLSAERHPDADRLTVCQVDVGNGGPAGIVCGAPNVAAGQTVAVARPGAVMPDGTVLGAARLRGVTSEGMILAEDELAIGTEHAGIIVLDDLMLDAEFAPGAPLADVLPIATDVLELEITPNRPDCLAVYGVARELHAAAGAALAPAPWAADPGSDGPLEGVDIRVECPDLCPRFTARLFEDVKIAPSPPWLKARLSAAGQRPINNVVDITNYVMLLTGQPLHAFDWDRVAGGRLTVRRADEGERVDTLDGQTRTLDAETVVIEDADGPTSIAGIMGGTRSEVEPSTTRVLMEAATWDGPNIRSTSLVLGLRSEASSRFEKGLAPEQAMYAQAVSASLMVALTGARLVSGTVDIGGPGGAGGGAPNPIRLRERRVEQILGAPIARQRQAEILRSLDFGVTEAEDGLDAAVPPVRRADVAREIDLIEEVGRIEGVDRLPATLPKRRGAYGVLSREQRLRRRAADALVGRGLHEIVGWSFMAPGVLDRLRLEAADQRRRAVALANPLSSELSLMRTTLLGSLLDAARHNVARGAVDLGLFELGTVFAAGDEPLPHEHRSLAVLLHGSMGPPTWRSPDPPAADFFAVRAMLEALSSGLRVGFELAPAGQPFLHPGRSAEIVVAGEPIGWLGELHPLVAGEWDLDAGAGFELDLDRLIAAAPAQTLYEDVISYPALRIDLAVILPEGVPAARVLELARAAAGELLVDVRVFDVYTGPQVGEGRRSLALALTFRAPDRTLTDEDVDPLREAIVAALAGELGGELRA